MSDSAEGRSGESLIRIERGRLDPKELAALIVLLLAGGAADASSASHRAQSLTAASWRRPERQQPYRNVVSWQS